MVFQPPGVVIAPASMPLSLATMMQRVPET